MEYCTNIRCTQRARCARIATNIRKQVTELSSYTFDEGKYEFYVEPGEYEIKVSLDSGIVTAADVTITNASVERNLELGE